MSHEADELRRIGATVRERAWAVELDKNGSRYGLAMWVLIEIGRAYGRALGRLDGEAGDE